MSLTGDKPSVYKALQRLCSWLCCCLVALLDHTSPNTTYSSTLKSPHIN